MARLVVQLHSGVHKVNIHTWLGNHSRNPTGQRERRGDTDACRFKVARRLLAPDMLHAAA